MKNINPYKTKLDEGNAYWMARLSKEVYKRTSKKDLKPNEEKILASIQKDDPKFLKITGYDNNSAQGMFVEHEDYLCMVFRGTDEALDWLDNINALPVNEIFGDFHRGFWNSTEDVWGEMYGKYIWVNKKNRRPLFLTGHSLGGAMATVAASKLIHRDLPFTSVYTFGQPRAMNRDTARIFNSEAKKRFYRFQNNNDIVSRVPARVMGYSHVGNCIYISEEQTIYDEPGFWFRFLDVVDGAVSDFREKGFDGVKDHNMDDYLKFIEKWDLDN